MTKNNLPNSLVQEKTDLADLADLLERTDPYIMDQVRRQVPRHMLRPEVLDLEIDELAQNVRIKLWQALLQRTIVNLQGYIRTMVRNEVINMLRRSRSCLPLITDEDGELYQGNALINVGEGMVDPAEAAEEKETIQGSIEFAVEAVATLPANQRRALICHLKDQIDDILPLVEAFQKRAIDIKAISWPTEKKEAQVFRTSLSIARKKLKLVAAGAAS
ncbi:MAG TPA: sigma-70 family RNA polymerase sigma factor [Ktedonobacteraceae bacterium]|nr:sigma-70 family RNA polymerase sigma factor [Ktedonobacteraceae bacterium]